MLNFVAMKGKLISEIKFQKIINTSTSTEVT